MPPRAALPLKVLAVIFTVLPVPAKMAPKMPPPPDLPSPPDLPAEPE